MDSAEKEVLKSNGINTLHIRYFDLDFKPGDKEPFPVIPVIFDQKPGNLGIIPVIFIKKRVFDRISMDSIPGLATRVFRLVSAICSSISTSPLTTQFDCDWTEITRDKYFQFLRTYKSVSKSGISCTIRLHQVKFTTTMGIPPVDYGVLMFYNIGQIDAGPGNSIYEKRLADKYSPFIQSYPLALDLGLPVFTWALQLREGKVIQLLNKMSFAHFEKDSNFSKITETR